MDMLNESDYSKASWNALVATIDALAALIEGEAVPTEEDAAKAKADIEAAMVALTVDFSELEAAIATAEGFTNELDFTVEDWKALVAAIKGAKAALTATLQSEIDAAVEALTAAINVDKLDRSALLQTIASSELFNAEDYTEESWLEFAELFDLAIIAFDGARTQAEIDKANSSLAKAIAALVEISGNESDGEGDGELDFSALQAAIDAADALKDKQAEYSNETWTKMTEALVKAKAALANAESQADIDDAAKALEDAVAALAAGDGSTTTKKDDTAASSDKKKGCGSAIAASAVVLATVLTLGVGFKKKED